MLSENCAGPARGGSRAGLAREGAEAARTGEPDWPVLRCPACRRPLDGGPDGWACRSCPRSYPVREGILRMLPALSPQERQTQQAFDFEHRRYEDARYLRISPARVEDWLADVQLPASVFAGATVLDAGCGTGRWSYAMAALGARVVAVDMSEAAVSATRTITRDMANVRVIHANVFQLPFAPQTFDFVVSWGVLHHTRDTVSAFNAIAPLVRPGGHLYVMVYETRSPLKVVGTELLRLVMRRLSPEARYRLCGRLVVRNRWLFTLLRPFVACVPVSKLSGELDAQTAQFGLYDWYSPRYNHLHRVEEVRGWFERAGFDDIQLTSPIRYTRRLDVLRFGRCGGSIKCRGRRRPLDGASAPGR